MYLKMALCMYQFISIHDRYNKINVDHKCLIFTYNYMQCIRIVACIEPGCYNFTVIINVNNKNVNNI